MGLVHVTIVPQAVIMIGAAHQTGTQRRVGQHRVSVGCTVPPTALAAYARPGIRKLPMKEIERIEPASRPPLDPVNQAVAHAEQVGASQFKLEFIVD